MHSCGSRKVTVEIITVIPHISLDITVIMPDFAADHLDRIVMIAGVRISPTVLHTSGQA